LKKLDVILSVSTLRKDDDATDFTKVPYFKNKLNSLQKQTRCPVTNQGKKLRQNFAGNY